MTEHFMAKAIWNVMDRAEVASRDLMDPYEWHRIYRRVVMPIGFEHVTGVAWEDIWVVINGD